MVICCLSNDYKIIIVDGKTNAAEGKLSDNTQIITMKCEKR